MLSALELRVRSVSDTPANLKTGQYVPQNRPLTPNRPVPGQPVLAGLPQIRPVAGGKTGRLSKVLTGKSPVTPDTALRIGAYFGNLEGAGLWLNLQQAYDLWHARARLAAELKAIKPLPGAPKMPREPKAA
jgi:hypothetical protein